MKKIAFCQICDNPISITQNLCNNCQDQLDNFLKNFNCNCDEDDWMTICRDCIMNSEKKNKWRILLSRIINSENYSTTKNIEN